MSNRELDFHYRTAQAWLARKKNLCHIDYFLALGITGKGLPPTGLVYRNNAEGTCVFGLLPRNCDLL